MSKYKKAIDLLIDQDYLTERIERNELAGYDTPKWMTFCSRLLDAGYTLVLYEASQTFSKYITVTHSKQPNKSYRVRFSNHSPNRSESSAGVDLFVGVSRTGVITTEQALEKVFKHFARNDNNATQPIPEST